MHRPLAIAGLWDKYESAHLLSPPLILPSSCFLFLSLSISLLRTHSSLTVTLVVYVLVSLESTVIFKSNQTLDHL